CGPALTASNRSSRPRYRNSSRICPLRPPAFLISLGCGSRSSTSARTPARPSSTASMRPVGPAPTMTTSVSVTGPSPRTPRRYLRPASAVSAGGFAAGRWGAWNKGGGDDHAGRTLGFSRSIRRWRKRWRLRRRRRLEHWLLDHRRDHRGSPSRGLRLGGQEDAGSTHYRWCSEIRVPRDRSRSLTRHLFCFPCSSDPYGLRTQGPGNKTGSCSSPASGAMSVGSDPSGFITHMSPAPPGSLRSELNRMWPSAAQDEAQSLALLPVSLRTPVPSGCMTKMSPHEMTLPGSLSRFELTTMSDPSGDQPAAELMPTASVM